MDRSRQVRIENSPAGIAIRTVLRASPMTTATQGVKRDRARGVGPAEDGRTRMTRVFFVIYDIYGAA